MRVPVWGSAMRHCRLLDHATHVFFVHFLVDAGTLSGCVQLFGSAAQARDIEYRMELDERPGRGGRAHHQLYQHRDAMQRVADIQERINYFQARLRHSVSSESGGGGGGGGGGPGILEASTWTWARVLGVDEDPEHALRGGRAWRVDLGRARRLTSHSRFAKTRVRVTVQPVLRPGQ
ncbi:uncharacterized protein LOC113202616 [Frankliniella occidentalis]|uniref:Uncharacterized protein LOC113202616 n=1 Tax=Frankliniella occidentalis TaxID=133901 RepID=A0A6J1S1M5_FRAOC|nr:uncharacterized protein LOC113202616 [Frankliniella occidentalis]